MKINEELSKTELKQAIISIRNIREKAKHDRQTFCRICLEKNPPLIRPCDTCSGSQAYVHPECLYRWRTQFNRNDRRYKYCELCRTAYTINYTNSYENYITILNISDIIQFALFITFFIIFIMFLSFERPFSSYNPYKQIILAFLNFNSIQILTAIVVREVILSVKLDVNSISSYVMCIISFCVFVLNMYGQFNFSIKLTSITYCINALNYTISGAQWKCHIKKLIATHPR